MVATKARIDINRLSGTVPVTLASLRELEEFSAHDNGLSGSTPDALLNLYNLVINDNRLTGSLSCLGGQVLILVRSRFGGRGCNKPCECQPPFYRSLDPHLASFSQRRYGVGGCGRSISSSV